MPEVLVLNPRRRRNRLGRFTKGARKSRRRRNPIAALAANPRRRRRARRRNPIALAANPRRRRSRRRAASGYVVGSRRIRRRKLNPRGSRRRYRRNPAGLGSIKSMLSLRGLTHTLMPAAIGGAGALGVDLALSYVPLPEWFQSNTGRIVARVLGAIGVGVIASFIVPRRTAALITSGALTVTAYGVIKEFASQNFPQLQGISPPAYGDMSDLRLGYLDPAPRLGAYMQRGLPRANGVGAYMRDSLDNVNSLSGVTSDGL